VAVVATCRKYRPRYLCFNGLVLVEQFCKLKKKCRLERRPAKGASTVLHSSDGAPGLCGLMIPWNDNEGCTHVFAIPSTRFEHEMIKTQVVLSGSTCESADCYTTFTITITLPFYVVYSGIVSHYTPGDRVRMLQNLKQLMIEDPDVTRWTAVDK
jgi:hypothetical protein